jgi:hypothetical protein
LAWCYGDPGVAAALLVAARRAGRPEWEGAALSIGEAAAARSLGNANVVETSLCHGSAGLAHVFNRIYQATRAEAARCAAVARLSTVIDACRPAQRAQLSPDLLTGSAGIGLALLAAASGVEPRWDRLLLLS